MIRNAFGLAFLFCIVSCVSSDDSGRTLRISVDNSLRSARGASSPTSDNIVRLKAYSYPSDLKFYTDSEVLRIIRFTCDKQVVGIRTTKPDDNTVSIAWNFSARGKGAGAKVLSGLPRFGATLTESESDVLMIRCGERVY